MSCEAQQPSERERERERYCCILSGGSFVLRLLASYWLGCRMSCEAQQPRERERESCILSGALSYWGFLWFRLWISILVGKGTRYTNLSWTSTLGNASSSLWRLGGSLIQAYEFNSLALNLEWKRMPFMSTCETWLERYPQVALSQGREQNKCSIQKALLLIYQHLPQ
jgi:hypothetical protein